VTTVRPLRDDDVDDWIRLKRASFGHPRDLGDAETRAILTSQVRFGRGVEDGGELVAACTWFPYPAWIGGVRVTIGALAAVVSAPESRRRGNVRELVTDGLRELHEAGVGWSLEYPFDPRFYARLGYRAFPNGIVLDMPIERLPGDARDAAFAAVPDLDPELRRIRARFASAHGFALDRDEPAPAADEATTLRWRRIFEAPSDEATPATAYRKVNQLVEAGLVTESVRIRPEGTNFREFELRVTAVRVTLTGEKAPDVTIEGRSASAPVSSPPVSTDGGTAQGEYDEQSERTEDRQERFRELFTEVTGTEEVTETRDVTIQTRYIDDREEGSVSQYVTALARDDGLSDTLSDPEN